MSLKSINLNFDTRLLAIWDADDTLFTVAMNLLLLDDDVTSESKHRIEYSKLMTINSFGKIFVIFAQCT